MKKILFSAVAAVMGVMSASALELVTNGGFESGPTVDGNWTAGGFKYCTPNYWSGGTGLQYKKSDAMYWCSSIYSGNYSHFFQQWASLSQVLNFPVAGKYRLTFAYTARGGYSPHYRCVNLGSKRLLDYTASSTSWSVATVDFEVMAPGPQTLSFAATSVSGDKCSCIDAVSCYLLTPAETVTDCSSWRQLKAVLEAGGNARLVKDVVQDSCGQMQLTGSQKVTVDLNGHSIKADTRVFDLYGKSAKLTLIDSVGGGVIDGQNISRSYAGGCVKVCSNNEFVFEGGTIQNFPLTSSAGGALYNEGTVTMKGGMITNCTATSDGGAIYNKATLTISGGTIVDSRAEGSASGGAISQPSGTLTLSGGMITNCMAKSCGGGIRATGGTINLSGTKIIGCKSNRNGNGIQMHGTITFNMTGGEVVGCSDIAGGTDVHGGAVLVWDGVTANFKGGVIANNSSGAGGGAITYGSTCGGVTISGGVFTNNTCSSGMELLYRSSGSKTATVTGGFFDKDPTTISANTTVNTVVDAANGFIVGNPSAANAAGELTGGTYTFCPTNEIYTGVGLAIADDATLSGSGSSWTITSTNPVECSTWLQVRGNLLANNSVKLVEDIDFDGAQAYMNAGQVVTIDLNGHTIRRVNAKDRLLAVGTGSKLTIVGPGVFDGQNYTTTWNGGFFDSEGGNSTLTITGDVQIINFKNSHANGGGAIYNQSGSTVTIYDGVVISNCTATKNGGAVYNTGSFAMNGGTIIDCTAASGGSAYVTGTFTMTGGMITNCTSSGSGGAIYCYAGTVTMTGGRIVGNTSGTWGGGVSISSGAKMTFEGGEISYNTANGDVGGGGICSSGKVTMKGGKLIGNKSKDNANSTAFYSNLDDSDLLYGGVIEGTIQRDQTADLYIYGGVYDRNQTALASGYTCTKVGDKYVVGVTPATDQNALMTGGSYTFCPTNAEYVAAGLSLGDNATAIDLGSGANWKVVSSGLVEVSDWLQMKCNLESGNSVKVMNDIQATTAHICPSATTNVTIDLNGFEVTQIANNYMFELTTAGTGTMTVMDSSAAGTGAFVGNGTTTGGDGGNWVRLYSSGRGVILESGTIRNFTLNNSYGGGAIKVFSGTTFTMNGGTISNCVTSGDGGAIRNAGTVRIYGGTIDHCRTTAGSGGALLSDTGTTTEIYGGTFSNNSVPSGAYGAVAYANAVIKIYGGYFVGNETVTAGYCKIIHGTGWNVYGYIYGGVFDNYDPVGTASSGNKDARCLSLQNGATVTRVGDNYVVGCNAAQDADQAYTGGQFTFPITNEIYTTKGVALAAGASVTQNGDYWVVENEEAVECSSWSAIRTAAGQGRNIKLAGNVTQDADACYLGQNQQITLDLNGYTLTKANSLYLFFLSSNGAKLTIEDSKGDGQIVNVSGGSVSADGGCIAVGNGELVLNGGTMSGFVTTDSKNGGFVKVAAGAKFTMNGGTIIDCTAAGNGGAVRSEGTFTMTGGTIKNCTASTNGGGVSSTGTFIMTGGLITGNTSAATYGAGVLQGGGTFFMYGGEISGNKSGNNTTGGAVTIDSTFEMYGGTIGVNLTKAAGVDSKGTVKIYGGVLVGNGASNLVNRDGGTMTVYGAVSDNAVIGTYKATGTVCSQVGSNYIVGKEALGFSVDSTPKLVNGEYTFCPTNAEYVAAGIVLDSGSTFAVGTNDVWTLTAPKPIAVSTWAQLKATLQAGLSAKLMADMNADSEIGITSSYDLTIDMNGKTVTRTASIRLFNYTKAKIHLMDSVGGGCFKAGSSTWPYRGSFALLGGGNSTFVLDGDITIDGFRAGGSTTEGAGGAFDLESTGLLIISNGTIRSCSANSEGGAIHAKSGATVMMAGGTITGCSAVQGGAVWNAGTFTMNGGTITNCSATSYGFAIRSAGGTLTIAGGLIVNNNGVNEGAVSTDSATLKVTGGVMKGNSSTNCGTQPKWRNIQAYKGTTTLTGGVFDAEPSVANVNFEGTCTVSDYRLVGSMYVSGTSIDSNADNELTHGIYTFCPTNAEYEATGLAVDTVNSTLAYTNEVWELTSNAGTPVNVSDWAQLCAALQAGYSVKLTNDIIQTSAQPILEGNQVVTVDLNGYTIDRKNVSNSVWCFATSSTNVCLTITDTSVGKTGRILGDPTKSHGSGGNALRVGSGKMIINGGTFEGMYATAGGGCAYVSAGATLEMNGGTITGCKTTGTDGYGAGVRCHGTFVMNGGTIANCTAEYYGAGVAVGGGGVFEMNGGTIAGCSATKASSAMGGGVWSAGTVDFNGGMITNCTAALNGGGISINPGTLNLKGGMIVDCWTPDYGGGVRANGGTINLSGTKIVGCRAWCNGNGFVVDGSCTFNMTGGEVIGCGDVAGKAARGWGGAVIFWTGVTANVYGGVIANNTTAGNGAAITFGSTCKAVNIYGGVFSNNVGAAAQKILYRYTDSSSTANVYGGIFDTNPTTTTAATTVRDVVKAGDWYVVGRGTLASGTTLTGGEYTFNPTNALYAACGLTTSVAPVEYATTPTTWTIDAKWYCVCGDETKGIPGHVHEKVMFLPWASTTTLPTGAGNYYLTGDVQLAAQWAAVNGVVLDLAGHTVTQKTANCRVVNVPANVTFTLTDSVGGGKLTGGNVSSAYGGCLYIDAASAKFTMYGGSICGNTAKSGAGLYANTASAIVKIYGGFIENNVAAEWGGGLWLNSGTHEIRNCIIRNNQAIINCGGGARFDNTTVEFIDCVITNNAAGDHGGFSACNKYSTKIALGGTTVMKDNHVIGQTAQDNLGVESGRTYTASTLVPLTDGAEIGVSSDVTPGSIPVTGINAADYAKYFFSDDDAYAIVNDLNQVKLTTVAQVCATIGETQYSSLQLALNSAVDGDTVKLVRNTTESVIVGPDGEITLDLAGFVLKANGGSAVTLSANANLTLTNSDETVTHYFTVGSDGRWAWNDSSTSGAVDYETLTARPAANKIIAIKGGCITGASNKGIYQNVGSTLVINGGSIVGNTGELGGGVYQATGAPAYLIMNGGRVCGNRSTCHAGGLYAHGWGTFTINGGDVAFNIAVSVGGAICNGYVNLHGGRLSWNSCAYEGNHGGGAIYTPAKIVMTGGEIVGNATSGHGGGVCTAGTFEMSGGVISNCTAASSGGVYVDGTATITGGEIVGCRATSGGGGAFSNAGTLKIYGGRIMNNSSKGYAGLCYSGSTCYTYFYGGVFSNNRSDTTDNKAIMYVGDNWTATGKLYGGVFDVDPTATAQSSNTLIKQGTVAVTKVGNWYVVGTDVLGSCGTLVNGTYSFCPTNEEYVTAGVEPNFEKCEMTIDETTDPASYTLTAGDPIEVSTWAEMKSALAAGKNVKLMQDMNADSYVGINSSYDLTIDMNGKTVTRTASDRLFNYTKAKIRVMDSVGGGRFTAGSSTWPYRASFALLGGNGSTFLLDGDVTIDGFRAGGADGEGQGGAFAVESTGSLIISNGVIRGCSANTEGGAVYLKSGATFTMNGGIITNCTAASCGGGVYAEGTFTLTGGEIAGNKTTSGRGGGAFITGSSAKFEMFGGSISGNTAGGTAGGTGNGGGVVIESSATGIIRVGSIKNNTANRYGGGIFNADGKLEVYGGEVSGNEATTGDGGGILTSGTASGATSTKIYGGVVKGNTAKADHPCLFSNSTSSQNTTVYGGVFDKKPTSVSYVGLGSGCVETLVGDNYVVGTGVAQVDDMLTGGTYTFCPTNAEYAAGGLAVLENVNITTAPTATPPTWTLDSNYTITLDAQGGTGGSESVTVAYGAAMPAITVPTRAGYRFGGYFDGKSGAGEQYYDDAGTSARTSDLNTNATLYAKWSVAGDPLGEAVGDGSIVMRTAAPYPWTVVSGGRNGTCLKSGGYHVNYASSALETTVASVKKVTFWWKVSSESYYDKVTFYVDGAQQAQISGSYNWTQVSVALDTSKEHILKWEYTKDCSCHGGSDCAWLDDLVLQRPFSGSGTADDPWILDAGGTEEDVLRGGATYKAGDPAKYFKDADEARGSGLEPVVEIPLDDIMRAKGFVAVSNGTYYRTFADAIAGCGGEPIKILNTAAKLPKFYKNEKGYLVPWDDEDWEGVITDPMDLVTGTPANFNAGETTGVRISLYGDDYLLGNNYIELGLRPGGAFGTRNYIPTSTGFHPNVSGRNSNYYLGLRATMTGWGEGDDPNGLLTRDFFTPGCIDEGWMVTVGTAVKGAGRCGTTGDSSVTKVYTKTAADDIAGVKVDQRFTVNGNIRVDQTVAFGSDDTQYWTYITLTNTGDSDLANVNYFRAFDPDQPGNCNYATDNYYHRDDDGGIWAIAFSYSTGVATYANFDDIVAKGRYPFFFYVEPSDDYTATPVTQYVGWYNSYSEFSTVANNYHRYADVGMGVRITFAKIAAGKSVTFRYLSSLDPNTDRAISAAKPIRLNGRYYTLAEAVLWVKSHGSNGQTFTVLDPKLTIEEVRLKFRTAGWDAEMTGTSGEGGTNRDFILKVISKHWVKLNLNRGRLPADAAANPIEFNTDSGVIVLPEPTRNNYDFAGWYASETFSGAAVTEVDTTGVTEDVVLYARWVAGVAVDITLTPYLSARGTTYTDPDRANNVTFTVKLYGNNDEGRTFIGTQTTNVTPSAEFNYMITNTVLVSCETGDYDSFTVETVSSRANYTSVSTDISGGAASASFVFAPEEFQFKYGVRVDDSALKAKIIGLDAVVVSPLNGTEWKVIQQLDYEGGLVHSVVTDGAGAGMYPVWSGKFDTYRYSVDVLGVYVEGDKYIPASAFGDALTVTVEATEGCTEVGGRFGAYYDGKQVGKVTAVVAINESSFYWAPAGTEVKLDGEYMTLAAATNAVAGDKPGYTGKTLLKVDKTISDRTLRETFAPTGLVPVRQDDGSYVLTALAAKLVRTHSDGFVHEQYFVAKEELTAASVEEGDHIVILDTAKIGYDDFKDAFAPFTVTASGTPNDYVVRSLATAAVTVTLDPKDDATLDPFAPTGVVFTVAFYGTYMDKDSKPVKEKLAEIEKKFSEEELHEPYEISFTTNFTYGIGAYTALAAEATVNRENYTVTGGAVSDDAATVAFTYHATVVDYTYAVSMLDATVEDAFRPTEIDLLITGTDVSQPITLPLVGGAGVGTNALASGDYALAVKGYRLTTGEYVAAPTDAFLPDIALVGTDWTVTLAVDRNSSVWKPNGAELPKSDEDDVFTNIVVAVENPHPGDNERTNVPIRVKRDWVRHHVPDYSEGTTSKDALRDRLSGNGENESPLWQSYILGLDPTNRTSQVYADAPQDPEPGRVTVKTKNVNPVIGYTVKYRLDTKLRGSSTYVEGEEQDSADFPVAVTGEDPTGLYKVTMLMSETGAPASILKAETINTVGMVKATNTNRFSVVAVPWMKLAPGEEQEIAVSNVLKTANLEAGDKLHVFNRLAKTYDTWTLNEQKEWDSVVTYAISSNGTVGASVSGAATTETIARGSGIWLERMNPTNAPYFLYGQASSNAVEYVIEEGHNLIGAPGIEPFDFSRVKGMAEGDQILVPGAVPKLYEFKDGVWGYYKTVAKTINVKGTLKTTFKAVWTTTENTAPAGTGFWLINKSGNPITIE